MSADTFLDAWAAVLAKHGDFPAIEGPEGQSCSAYELDRRASRVAAGLQTRGVGAGSVVASRLGRRVEAVVLWLATWRVGATWLPLEPSWPHSPVAAIVAVAKPTVLVVASDLPLFEHDSEPAPHAPLVSDLAWLIATSGTTGTPRLVEVTHRGFVPMLRAQLEAFALQPGARVLSALSTGFDATLSDWGTALLSASTLVLAPDGLLTSPAIALDFLRSRHITHADLPPALLPLLDPEKLPPGIATVIVGGEASDPAVLRRWAKRVRTVNVYGPTEATVCCALNVVDDTWDAPMVGDAIAETSLHVEPDQVQGGAGELWIGGPLLAAGYRDDPVATDERFVLRGGERWFRTGDRVRARADGRLDFLGRVSAPLKLSGQRVEIGELERALAGLPDVRGVVVLPRQLPSGRWVAAATLESAQSPATLRSRALAVLSAAWVPADWRVVETLPRLSNGKVDRTALAATRAPNSSQIQAIHGPLADAWLAVLGVRPTRGDDRFDLLGGDSLAVLELSQRLASEGVDVDPVELAGCLTFDAQVRLLAHHDALHAHHDASLSDHPAPASPLSRVVSRRSDGRTILVTGAGGLLGRSLVQALLDRTDRPVLALVRKGSKSPWDSHGRLTVTAGDVRLPLLGMPERLLASIGTVVHLAADLSLARSESELARTNVTGTAQVVALAARLGAHLHHVSTLSVFTHQPLVPSRVDETSAAPEPANLDSAYARTKRRAELEVEASIHLPSTTWRPGLLLDASARRGDDHFSRVVRGLAQLGTIPDDLSDARFDVTPLAWMVEALVRSLDWSDPPGVLHVAGPRTWSFDALGLALRAEGVALDRVPRAPWEQLPFDPDPDVLMARRSLGRNPGGFRLFEATGTEFRTTLLHERVPGLPTLPGDDTFLRVYVRAALGQP